MLADRICLGRTISFTFDENEKDKLIIKTATEKFNYQLQLNSSPDIDFQQLKNSLLSQKFKIVLQSQDRLKIKIGFSFFQLKNLENIAFTSLKQTINEMNNKLKQQYQRNSFLEDSIIKMRIEIDLMEIKMDHLSKINEQNKNKISNFQQFSSKLVQQQYEVQQQFHQVKNQSTIINQIPSAQQLQLHEQLRMKHHTDYKFSEIHKHQDISLQNDKTKIGFAYPSRNRGTINGIALVDGNLSKKGSSIRFRIQKIEMRIRIGLGIRDVIASHQYKLFNYARQTGHGCFILGNSGSLNSHSSKGYNKFKSEFEYSKGDVIRIETNVNELCFFNQIRNFEYKMPIQMTEEEWQKACFCVCLNFDIKFERIRRDYIKKLSLFLEYHLYFCLQKMVSFSLFPSYLKNSKSDCKNSLHTEILVKKLTQILHKKWGFVSSGRRPSLVLFFQYY